ncbi:hypothetical protein [Sphingomonas sp. 3-13AW]|uniref:hypothetical protein n=1 Tax=Sphingomonas sp. 3-13AW TaxID=3050450 RepID=UPI003BB4C897
MSNSALDVTCSCSIGDDLRIYGSNAAISRVQELYGRRDRRLDAGLPRNRRVEDSRARLGTECMNIGRLGTVEELVVTGNADAMSRMQAIYLAASRRRASAARLTNLGCLTTRGSTLIAA